jgi:hypothetical protein
MDIEFDCGMIAKSVGAIGMACKAHIGKCENKACQADVKKEAEKYKNVLTD